MAVAANADTMMKHSASFNDAAPADFDIATNSNTRIHPNIGECRRGLQRYIRVTCGDKLRKRAREIAPRPVADNYNGFIRQRAKAPEPAITTAPARRLSGRPARHITSTQPDRRHQPR